MKVIAAGLSKTGTKSLCAALKKLGYSVVYDFAENMFVLSEEYNGIVFEGWTTDDFRRMYENVDAVVDFPACFFWDEIHKAFPDAKIILTVRNDEDEWLHSLEKQTKMNQQNLLFRAMQILSPTCKRSLNFIHRLTQIVYGGVPKSDGSFNKQLAQRLYRQHNAYVMHSAPKDKLLVYMCSEGWDPLCHFLGVPVPDEPFPHKNIDGDLDKNVANQYPVFRKIQREILVSSIVLLSATMVTGIAVYKNGLFGIIDRLGQGTNLIMRKVGF